MLSGKKSTTQHYDLNTNCVQMFADGGKHNSGIHGMYHSNAPVPPLVYLRYLTIFFVFLVLHLIIFHFIIQFRMVSPQRREFESVKSDMKIQR